MTFGWAAGEIYIFARGQKVANLRRNPSCTVLVDTGDSWPTLQGIMVQGVATVLEDLASETAHKHLDAARYNLGVKHNLTRDGQTLPYAASASGASRRWIVIRPEHIVTWDNQKLQGDT